jgi:hypothetical protein
MNAGADAPFGLNGGANSGPHSGVDISATRPSDPSPEPAGSSRPATAAHSLSWHLRSATAWTFFLLVFAIILIAVIVLFTPAIGVFDLKNALWALATLLLALWLLCLGLAPARGHLRWVAASGEDEAAQWFWQAQGQGQEQVVRVQLALDFQSHLLLRLQLAPLAAAPASLGACIQNRVWAVWLCVSPANVHASGLVGAGLHAVGADWPALRRALYWRAGPSPAATAKHQAARTTTKA